jgi:hypothetical protein
MSQQDSRKNSRVGRELKPVEAGAGVSISPFTTFLPAIGKDDKGNDRVRLSTLANLDNFLSLSREFVLQVLRCDITYYAGRRLRLALTDVTWIAEILPDLRRMRLSRRASD